MSSHSDRTPGLYGFPERLWRLIDDCYPELGPSSPCGLCGDTILGQRHRIIDAITERSLAGESMEVAEDYGLKEVDLWPIVAASYEHEKALARQRRAERKRSRAVATEAASSDA